MEAVERIIFTLALNTIVRLVVVAVVMDTIFGIGRAIREHKFNSSVGIDGAIRKIAMVISIVFLGVVAPCHINLIAFNPEEVRSICRPPLYAWRSFRRSVSLLEVVSIP